MGTWITMYVALKNKSATLIRKAFRTSPSTTAFNGGHGWNKNFYVRKSSDSESKISPKMNFIPSTLTFPISFRIRKHLLNTVYSMPLPNKGWASGFRKKVAMVDH